MKIAHVNNVDLIGNRFNGHDMQIALNNRGFAAKQFVMEKLGDNPNTILLTNPLDEPFLRDSFMTFEKEFSIQSYIYPYLWRLLQHPKYKSADIVHYHLIHNSFCSLPSFSKLVKAKPSVLTIHDLWLFTGHCIGTLGCEKWRTGCGECTHLDTNFKVLDDNTHNMWLMKKNIFSSLNLDIVVASPYMLNIVKRSPITSNCEHVHYIPFGIDTSLFSKDRDQNKIRTQYGIPMDNFVICFRADESPFKGLKYVKKMLDILKPSKPVTLIAVGNKHFFTEYENRYQVIDFDWVTDDKLMADLYCASDLLLQPSLAEAFGLMAVEAMASSCTVVVFTGTALPDITSAPDCGIAIPQGDILALKETVERLINNPEECKKRGELGRKLVETNYRFEDYVTRHINLYEEILERNI